MIILVLLWRVSGRCSSRWGGLCFTVDGIGMLLRQLIVPVKEDEGVEI